MKKNLFPEQINSKRLLLRMVSLQDLEEINNLVNKNFKRLHETMYWADNPPELLVTREFILQAIKGHEEGKEIHYSICDKFNNKIIGIIGAYKKTYPGFFEIGYWIDENSEGFGYTSEATQVFVDILKVFSKARRIQIRCAVDNLRSMAIPKKLGFIEEGILKNYDMKGNGEVHDSIIFSLT